MELYQLRSLITVSETENFTRAAAQLNVTQPALSQQIINLEKELNQKLFHRLGRRVVPSEAGLVLLDYARRILLEADNAAKALHDHPGLDRRITVGAIPSVASFMLTSLIAQARIDHPNLQIDIREDFRAPLLQGVVTGHLDLAILAAPVREPSLAVETLLREPLLLAVGRQHPLARRQRARMAELADETFAMLGSADSLFESIRAFWDRQQCAPRIGYRCAQVATVKSLVALGAGVAILPRSVQSSKDSDTLAYLHFEGEQPERELVVVRHLQRYQSRGVTQFLAMLKAGRVSPAAP